MLRDSLPPGAVFVPTTEPVDVPVDDAVAVSAAAAPPAVAATGAQVPDPARAKYLSVAELRARCAERGPRKWAVKGLWIQGTPMVVGAEEKSGKSVGMLDLAISVASGVPWLGSFEVEQTGPVLCFWGEDDEHEVLRRFDAICAHKGLDPDSVPVRMCFSPPDLSRPGSLMDVAVELDEFPAVAVILDPLYLAVGAKGDGANLYAMGPLLRGFGDVCRSRGAAPVVIHHWNKNGQGTGRARLSGTGTTQWARTILSMSVAALAVDQVPAVVGGVQVVQSHATATLQLEFTGNSIVSRTTTVRRRMWAEDPNDLNSALRYAVEEVAPAAVDGPGDQVGKSSALSASSRALVALRAIGGWATKGDVQEWDANHLPVRQDGSVARPLLADTVYKALVKLAEDPSVVVTRMAGRSSEFAVTGSVPVGEVDTSTPSPSSDSWL